MENTTKDLLIRLLTEEKNSLKSALAHAQFNLSLEPQLRVTPIEDEDMLRRSMAVWQRELKVAHDALYEISKL